MDAVLDRLRGDAVAVLPAIVDVARRVASVAWWPAGGDPARPRVRTTVTAGTPTPGDPQLVVAYRVACRQIAAAHAWLPHGTVWRPVGVFIPPTAARDVPLGELTAAAEVLRGKLTTLERWPVHDENRWGAVTCVLAAWDAFPADIRTPPPGWSPPRPCACGCGRLTAARRGRYAQVCANRATRQRQRNAA